MIAKEEKMAKENCILCGEQLKYLTVQEEMECSFCGRRFLSSAKCKNGHFVCDRCHREKGVAAIRRICFNSSSRDPVDLIQAMMEDTYIYMHGPEHHIMVGAALLTAYKNAGGSLDWEAAFEEMVRRGSQVPGGTCGFWGCCGAAISCGIFFSLAASATPLSQEAWGMANQASAKALMRIGKYGGPRCCKRDSFLSILTGMELAEEQLGVKMEGKGKRITCSFFEHNQECIKERCPFYGRKL